MKRCFIMGIILILQGCDALDKIYFNDIRRVDKTSRDSIILVCTPETEPLEVMTALWTMLIEDGKNSSWAGEVWLSFILDEYQFDKLFGLPAGEFQTLLDRFLFSKFLEAPANSVEKNKAGILIRQSKSVEAKAFTSANKIPEMDILKDNVLNSGQKRIEKNEIQEKVYAR